MTNSNRNEVNQRVLGTLFFNALMRWESLVTVIVTLILYLFVNDISVLGLQWQPWFWLVMGTVAEAALIFSTMTDPEETQAAMSKEFEKRYDLNNIKNRVSRDRLRSALEYRRDMLKLVKQHKGAMRSSLRQTVDDINAWIAHMYDMSEHIDAFEKNELVERDMQTVPQKIDRVRVRIERENDPQVRADLENQLRQLEQQKLNLEATVNSIKRAEIQLESTLSSLGTIYAQMSLLGTKDVDSARAQRLRLDIQAEVASLQDTADAMDEIQMQGLNLR